MPVGLNYPQNIKAVKGVKIGVANARFKDNDKNDLVLFSFDEGTNVSGVFTTNAFQAGPVTVAKNYLSKSATRGLVINSGNANAGTGKAGIELAESVCNAAAEKLGCDKEAVLPFSTGVIGQLPKLEKYIAGLDIAFANLSEDNWLEAAVAIMTTDTIPKAITVECELAGQVVTITGISKGSGMIRPNMATMLGYIATDIAADVQTLQSLSLELTEQTFNRVTVDGDMSTNDACMLISTAKSNVTLESLSQADADAFKSALRKVYMYLAQALVRDGEGATKFVTVDVSKSATKEEALKVAYQVAHSPLVKTALFASDPNWGRILAAVGSAGINGLDYTQVSVYLDDVLICCDGGVAKSYTEAAGAAVFAKDEFAIRIELNRGDADAKVYTSDFSYDYVKINAEYRT